MTWRNVRTLRYDDSSSARFLGQRSLAAVRADSDLSSGVIFAARTLPPQDAPRSAPPQGEPAPRSLESRQIRDLP